LEFAFGCSMFVQICRHSGAAPGLGAKHHHVGVL